MPEKTSKKKVCGCLATLVLAPTLLISGVGGCMNNYIISEGQRVGKITQ